MSQGLRDAMLDQMAVLGTSITTLNMSAGELVRSAGLLDGQPASDAMRNVARQQRVKILEMHWHLAALHEEYATRFHSEG